MPDPISLAVGYFLLKTAVSMGLAIKEGTNAEDIGNELSKAAGGNFYYDLIKSGVTFGWNNIISRVKSEYNSNKPLNHDLQKAVRKAQIEATLSACESCFGDLKIQDATLLEKLRNKLSLNEDERWLKNVVQTLTKNLAEIRDENYIPPIITDNIDVLKLADIRNYPLTDESVQNLVNSIKDQTILEIRFANPPSHSQKQIASSLEHKIYNGWTKNFQGETILIDWYKLLCDRFNEEYKTNQRVTNALQKAFFQDLKSDFAGKFTNFSEKHFEELGGKILSKLESIEGKQDRLYNFVEIFKDETDRKLTEALALLKTSVFEINVFTERKAEETQDVIQNAKSEIINEVKTQNKKLFEHFDERFDSFGREIQIQIQESTRKNAEFRRNILAKRNLTIIEKLLGNRRFAFFDILFGKLTPQEEFFVSLKERYASRYYNKLDGRFEITLMVSDNLESEVKKEYTGIYEGRGQLNEAFEYMRNAFQDANRLLIVGEPGVGKTVLLLKFANDLLDKTSEKLKNESELRLDDIKDPMPVIFNLASWSENYTYFKDWLIAMLKTGEGLSEKFADELLSQKKIFLLLDGLDELAKNEDDVTAISTRTKCFNSLVDYLKGGQKAVICCRVDEYLQIRKDIGQEDSRRRGKIPEVFVKNLTKAQIQDALNCAAKTEVDKESALNLLELLEDEKSGVLLEVLSIPFYFTTALEVFDSSILKEKNVPANEKQLKNFLLEKLVLEKLEKTLSSKKTFNYKKSLKWLKWLALFMQRRELSNFELANLQSRDLKKNLKYIILFSIVIAFYFSISSWGLILFMGFGILLIIKKLDLPPSNLLLTKKSYRRFFKYSFIGVLINSYVIYLAVFIFIPVLITFALLFGDNDFFTELYASLYRSLFGLVFIVLTSITQILIKSIFTGFWGSLIEISDFKTEDIIEWKLDNLLYWKSWQKILIHSVIYSVIGIIIGLLLVFITSNMKKLTLLHINNVFINQVEERNLFVNFTEAIFNFHLELEGVWIFVIIATIIGFTLNLKNSCQTIKQFAFIRNPYQRLKGGIIYNSFDWMILFLAIVVLELPYTIYSLRDNSSQLRTSLVIHTFVVIPIGIIWGIIGGFLFSSLGNHFLLRICFFIERVMPLKFVKFLNYVTKAKILENDGGNWRFRHQELQDYFAKLP